MVGGEGGAGRVPAQLTPRQLTPAGQAAGGRAARGRTGAVLAADVRAAYESAAAGWAAGPAQVYGPLARALVGAASVPVTGRRVLDLGAGTGMAGRAALAAGAGQVVAADLAGAMLRLIGPPQRPVAADAVALPFRDGAFDLVVAAFCLNHLSRPGGALGEIRRVGRGLAASAFAPGWTHPAKLAVDGALRPFGFRPPAWYEAMTGEADAAAQDPAWLVPRPPPPASPACGSPRSRFRPDCPPRRSWRRGGWAWRTMPRSCGRWTRRGGRRRSAPPRRPRPVPVRSSSPWWCSRRR